MAGRKKAERIRSDEEWIDIELERAAKYAEENNSLADMRAEVYIGLAKRCASRIKRDISNEIKGVVRTMIEKHEREGKSLFYEGRELSAKEEFKQAEEYAKKYGICYSASPIESSSIGA